MENLVIMLMMLTILVQLTNLNRKNYLPQLKLAGNLKESFPIDLNQLERNFYSYGDYLPKDDVDSQKKNRVKNEKLRLNEQKAQKDEETKLLQQIGELKQQLKKVTKKLKQTKKYFKRVIKVTALRARKQENKNILLEPNRILHNLVYYNLGNDREVLPEDNPGTENSWAYFVEIDGFKDKNSFQQYETEKIIDELGGDKVVWDQQTFTLQQIEEFCLQEELEEKHNYHFFFQGLSITQKVPKLMIMTVIKEGENIFFILEYSSIMVLTAQDVLLLKQVPDPEKFKLVN